MNESERLTQLRSKYLHVLNNRSKSNYKDSTKRLVALMIEISIRARAQGA